jgi:general stress protein 26
VNYTSFSEIEKAFIERVHSVVWCNVATIDSKNRVRSRVLHPIWEGDTGRIATRRHSLKAQHLARNPYVSLAYIADPAKPVYVDCTAEWDDELAHKQHIWDMFKSAPPPLGYDPEPIYKTVDDPNYGLLKLTPWRIEMRDLMQSLESHVWHAAEA